MGLASTWSGLTPRDCHPRGVRAFHITITHVESIFFIFFIQFNVRVKKKKKKKFKIQSRHVSDSNVERSHSTLVAVSWSESTLHEC
jgi:hypothetical protein